LRGKAGIAEDAPVLVRPRTRNEWRNPLRTTPSRLTVVSKEGKGGSTTTVTLLE
jgi:hypothetical protein